jgi:hypothetical protein
MVRFRRLGLLAEILAFAHLINYICHLYIGRCNTETVAIVPVAWSSASAISLVDGNDELQFRPPTLALDEISTLVSPQYCAKSLSTTRCGKYRICAMFQPCIPAPQKPMSHLSLPTPMHL